MYPRAGLIKAELKTFDKKTGMKDVDGDISVEFKFNPTDISIERGCGFDASQSDPNAINDYGGLKFAGAKSDQLTMSFVLDSTEPELTDPANVLIMMSPIIVSSATNATAKAAGSVPILGAAVNDESVTGVLGKITNMTKLSKQDRDAKKKNKKEIIYPRLVKFTWGKHIEFSGAIEKFSFKLTLFDSDGVPKRAEVDIGMIGIFGTYSGEPEDLLFGEGESKATSSRNV